MVRLGLLIFIAILIAAGAAVWYGENYNNMSYYVQIHNDGEIERDKDSHSLLGFYRYKIKGFNTEGVEKQLDFTTDHNLRHGAYLKVRENKKRGVISWTEIKQQAIPKKPLEQLERQRRSLTLAMN